MGRQYTAASMARPGDFVYDPTRPDYQAHAHAIYRVLRDEHPEQRALLSRDPAAIPNAVEEMLRYESPAQALPRRVLRDVELHVEYELTGDPGGHTSLWARAHRRVPVRFAPR